MLIDVNASFGGRESIQRYGVDTLERELDATPYALAFVSANEGVFDQQTANDHVFALCEANERWLPAATLHPGDTFSWREELTRSLEAGVRLFRINPVKSGWAVDSILLSLLIDRLAGTGAALLVESAPAGLPSAVVVRTSQAGVPVIFSEARYFPLTELIPLSQHYQDVFIETSRLTSPGGIALCVREIGSHRLLYGSGANRYPANVAWQLLCRADIAPAEREAIAWRNAATLFNLDPAPLFFTQTNAESNGTGPASRKHKNATVQHAMSELRQADPIERETSQFPPAIDIHLHDKFAGAPFPRFSAEGYEAELRRNQIVAGVSSSATAIFHDLKRGNDENEALLSSVPGLKGYVVVDPRYLDDSIQELERLHTSDFWVGVKIHCAHAKTLTGSAAMTELMAAIAEQRKPLLVHPLGADWPEALCMHAARHPELPIIAAHAGYGDAPHPTHDAALRLSQAPNIVIEFCSTYLAPGAIRRGIEAVGVDRVLFGSDFPLLSLEYMRVAYESAELSAAELDAIYLRNAARLFPSLGAIIEEVAR